MEVQDSFTVPVPASDVWELLWDFARLAACLPGCEGITPLGAEQFRTRLKQAVGPFKLELELTLSVIEQEAGRRVVFAGSGADRQGNRLRLNRAAMELTTVSEGETELAYVADFNLVGRLASLGYPVVKRKAAEIGAEFSRRLAEAASGRSPAGSPGDVSPG